MGPLPHRGYGEPRYIAGNGESRCRSVRSVAGGVALCGEGATGQTWREDGENEEGVAPVAPVAGVARVARVLWISRGMERALSAGGGAWRPVATSAAAETGDQDAGAAIRGIEIGGIEMRG